MARESESKSSNGPVARFRSFGIEATVWSNDKGKSVTVKKTYKDESGDYQETNTFFPDELARLAMVASRAHEYCNLRFDDCS